MKNIDYEHLTHHSTMSHTVSGIIGTSDQGLTFSDCYQRSVGRWVANWHFYYSINSTGHCQ